MSGAYKGIALVVLTVLAIWGGDRLLFPHGSDYTVRAEFKDAGGLTKNSNVKIGGIAGGRISDIKLTSRDTALVTMALDKGAYPIGEGATAASRPVNLLGEKYVDLNPGDPRKPLASGASIGMNRTSRPVELDDVLNVLAPDVRARMRILINEAGIALAGRGADFNTMLDQFPAALDQTAKLVGSFSEDSRRLGDLIEESDRVLASMAARDDDLQDLVSSASDTLAVTAAKRRELGSTVREVPGTLNQLRTTMAQVVETSQRLEPAAAQVRRVSPVLSSTLAELPSFEDDAKPALAALRKTSPSVVRLSREGRAPIRRLKTTAGELRTFVEKLGPLAKSFDEHGMKEMLGLMDGWSRTIAKSDGLGHIFGLRIIFDRTLMTALVDKYVGPSIDPAKKKRRGGERPAADRPAVKLPKLDQETLRKPLEPVKEAVDKVKGTVQEALSGLEDAVGSLVGRGKQPQSGGGSDTRSLLNYLVGP